MRSLVLSLVILAACSRSVRVETAPPAAVAAVSVKVTNTAQQSVTISVEYGGTEYTLKPVAANSTEIVPVPNVPSGSTVKLRARLADGSRSYTRDGVVLTGVFEWTVP
jgi:hypothetical protein